jgi:hypothetical protein
MSKIERLLIPGSTERPDCRCGQEMTLAAAQNDVSGDTEPVSTNVPGVIMK